MLYMQIHVYVALYMPALLQAEGPLNIHPDGCCGEEELGSKILAAYKLFVGGRPLGVGPGRAQCGAVAQGACVPSTPYDGFALHGLKPGATVDVRIHAYGQHQPAYHVSPKVIFKLVVRLRSGKVLSLHTGDASASQPWSAFDADCGACSLYSPSGNTGGRFGAGYWYYYPHENINASCLPSEDGG